MLPKQIPNSKNLKLIIREYEAKDSHSLINLENESSQIPFTLYGLINMGKVFGAPFDYKCQKYKDSIMLVVEHIPDMGEPKICAGACLGIKDIFFNNRKLKAGYLFDLRVSEHYQRLGIGRSLSECLEEMGKAKGIEMLFLGVNGDNQKAIPLYQKLGFEVISQRRIWHEKIDIASIRPPLDTKVVSLDDKNVTLVFKKISPEAAREYTSRFYNRQDLALQDHSELVQLESYDGTYIAQTEDGNHIAGASIVRIRNETMMAFKRFIVPDRYLFQEKYNSLLLALILAIIMPLIFLIRTTLRGLIDNIIADFASIMVFICLGYGIIYILFTGFTVIKQFSGYEGRARVIAPFQFGNPKYSKALFDFLREEMQNVCRVKNIQTLTYNVDSNDTILMSWQPKGLIPRAKTLFMAKAVVPSYKLDHNMRSDYMYFDPRDF